MRLINFYVFLRNGNCYKAEVCPEVMGDTKNYLIVILVLVIAALGVYIGVGKYNQKQNDIRTAYYEQGLRDGQLYEQRNVILQLQGQGFYALNFIDANNETQTIRLGLIQQQFQLPEAGQGEGIFGR